MTLELQDVPEARALETLLRSASGYIAKPRVTTVAGGSTYDRIMIMAASRAPAVSSVPQQFNRPQQPFNPPLMPDDDEPGNNTVLPPGALPPGAIGQMNGPQPLPPQMYPGAPPMAPGVQPQQPAGANQPLMTAPRPGQLPTPMPAFPGNPYQMPPQPQGTRPGGGN